MDTQDNATGADQYVDYDVTGKVTDVYSDAAKTVATKITHYSYDDRGFRLSKETYKDGALQFTTWYIRDASGNVLSIYNQTPLSSGEGQGGEANLITLEEIPIYGSGKLGMYRPKSNGGGEFVYELTDHLGNVRATVKNDQSVYLATMEDTQVNDMTNPRVTEGAYFTNLFETEKRDTRMNHTPSSTNVTTPANSSYLSWTTNDTNKKMIGVGITLKVEAGDQLNLEAYAKYQNASSYTRDATAAMMAGLLSSAFVGTNGLELTTTAAQDFTNAVPLALSGTNNDTGTRPFAYLNYIVFDQSFVFKDGGAMRVPSTAGFDAGMEAVPGFIQRVAFDNPISISQTGYIYVWVSNESANTQVWWDDLKVTHTGNRVTQATDYYPFGLVMRSQTLQTEPTYRFGYQGKYAEKDDETGWNHFELREFDPVLGRWFQVDPKGQFYSPYIGMGNNPILGIDPDGGFDIVLNGKNNSSLTIKTEIVAEYDVDFDFKGKQIIDATRVFIGFDKGVTGNASVFHGMDGSLSIMSGIFLGGKYALYPYDYFVAQGGQNLSGPELSASGFKNLVLGIFKGSDLNDMTPQSIEGPFTYYGLSVSGGDGVTVGAGVQKSVTSQWDIWEIGITAGVGAGIPINAQLKTNRIAEYLLKNPGAGTGTWMLNRNVIPTANRPFGQKLIAPFLLPGLR